MKDKKEKKKKNNNRSRFGRGLDTVAARIQDERGPLNVVEPTGVPNPLYGRIKKIYDDLDGFRAISQGINDCAKGKGPHELDRTDFLHGEEMLRLKAEFFRLVEAAMSQPPTVGQMPAPPSAAEVFNRFTGTEEVIDVGGGDAEKQSRTAEIIRAPYVSCDPKTGSTCMEVVAAHPEAVVVSRNSLTQLGKDEVEQLAGMDGVHVYPDVIELAKAGVLEEAEEGLYKVVNTDGEKWVDRPIALPGQSYGYGYRASNTYAPRRIECDFEPFERENGEVFPTRTYPDYGATCTEDLGWKIDGVMARVQSSGGACAIFFRNGRYFLGKSTGPDFSLTVELVGGRYGPGKPRAFLVRVEQFRTYVPFHGGAHLRYFASRVKIRLKLGDFDTLILPPPEFDADEPRLVLDGDEIPTDGLIYRTKKDDFYVKTRWTFDTDDPLSLVKEATEQGWQLDFEDTGEGLWEYEAICVLNGTARARKIRPRTDKLTGTRPEQVVKMLSSIAE